LTTSGIHYGQVVEYAKDTRWGTYKSLVAGKNRLGASGPPGICSGPCSDIFLMLKIPGGVLTKVWLPEKTGWGLLVHRGFVLARVPISF
jgi:hypothetical protein